MDAAVFAAATHQARLFIRIFLWNSIKRKIHVILIHQSVKRGIEFRLFVICQVISNQIFLILNASENMSMLKKPI